MFLLVVRVLVNIILKVNIWNQKKKSWDTIHDNFFNAIVVSDVERMWELSLELTKKQDEWNAKLIVEKFLQYTEDFEGNVMLMSKWHWFTHYNLYFSATEFLNGVWLVHKVKYFKVKTKKEEILSPIPKIMWKRQKK